MPGLGTELRKPPKIEDEAPPLYQSLTAPTDVGLLGVSARRGSSRSSSAWLGRSQKDGLPPAAEELTSVSRPSTRAQGEGQPSRCPFLNRERKSRHDRG